MKTKYLFWHHPFTVLLFVKSIFLCNGDEGGRVTWRWVTLELLLFRVNISFAWWYNLKNSLYLDLFVKLTVYYILFFSFNRVNISVIRWITLKFHCLHILHGNFFYIDVFDPVENGMLLSIYNFFVFYILIFALCLYIVP